MPTEIIKVNTENDVIDKLWELIGKAAEKAIAENGVFRVGLSGGSLIRFMATGASKTVTDWTKWKLFFCDERFVEEDDEDSTFGQYKKDFVPHTKLELSQFLTINTKLQLTECAQDYERAIYKAFDIQDLDFKTIPQFDLLLLGMGPDGHTCSLFPNHRLLKEDQVLIAPIDDSPKPPPKRITMTYSLIRNAKACIFPMSGSGKAELIKEILVDRKEYPAGLVDLPNGTIYWILDGAAASKL